MRRALVVAALAGSIALPSPLAAHAASPSTDILVSDDGVTFAPSLDRALFGELPIMIPGDALESQLWVRNPTDREVYLRVSIHDVEVSDARYASALSVRVDAGKLTGSPLPLSAVDECIVVTPPIAVDAGSTTAITAVLLLSDLSGRDAQGASAAFDLGVSMTDRSMTPSEAAVCGATKTIVPGTTTPTATPTPTPTAAVEPGDDADGSPWANTARLFEEYFSVVLAGAFIIGATWFVVVARRGRRGDRLRAAE